MSNPSSNPAYSQEEITFNNSHKARLVKVPRLAKGVEVATALGLPEPKAVFLVIGGTKNNAIDEALKTRLTHLFRYGLVPALERVGGMVLDGGTQAGIIELLGESLQSEASVALRVGVAPFGKVTWPGQPADEKRHWQLDPNHTHFAVVEDGQTWGDETKVLFELANCFSKRSPVMVILIGGGDQTKVEALLAVRKGWPLFILEDTGRLAKTLAKEFRAAEIARERKLPLPSIDDPLEAEIIADANIYLITEQDTAQDFEQDLRLLTGNEGHTLIEQVNKEQKIYSDRAVHQQNRFKRLQKIILTFGVLIPLFTAIQVGVATSDFKNTALINDSWPLKWDDVLNFPILLLPILTAALVTAYSNLNPGTKWTMLRAASEALKSETFRYRTKSGLYSNQKLLRSKVTREAQLAETLKSIRKQWLQTEVKDDNVYLAKPPKSKKKKKENPPCEDPPPDDKKSFLTSENYIQVRLEGQINWYKINAAKLSKQIFRAQIVVWILGATGTLLAAFKWSLIVSLTAAAAAALIAYLEYTQKLITRRQYNQTIINLEEVKGWWQGLKDYEKLKQGNIDRLVELTETALQTEQSAWVQQLQTVPNEIRKQEGAKDANSANPPTDHPTTSGQPENSAGTTPTARVDTTPQTPPTQDVK